MKVLVITIVLGLSAAAAGGAVLGRIGEREEQAPSAASGQVGRPAPIVPDSTGFDPALIIDDAVFYDSQAMSPQEVEAFIARVNAGCVPGSDGTPCLAEATFATQDREPTTMCASPYEGADEESAAQVISKVAAACDVNPQVLLVLIHKEQGLLTASGPSLTARDYEAAAGYACPDGAQCDGEWAGFFQQIYGAASQFQRYRLDPWSYDVVAGVGTRVAYSPEPSCGAAALTVVNQATAGLYNYTPFQPNEAVSSGGDDCTSWGNWNFYGFFRVLFGDPALSRA